MEPKTVEEVLALIEQRPADAERAELFQLLGNSYLQAGQLKEARTAYEQSLALAPFDPWTHLYLGNWFSSTSRWREALEQFGVAATFLPDEAMVYICRGGVYQQQGRYDLAEKAYRKAVRVSPKDQKARQRLAELTAKRRKKAVDISPFLIKTACNNDYAATTVLLAARWLQTHPNDVVVLLHYAEMLYKMTRYEEGIRAYEEALELDSAGAARWIIFNKLGELHEYRGHFPEAEPWFQKAIKVKPDDAGSYIFLGAVQARQGKLKDAEDTHRAATRCTEGCIGEAYHNLGLVLRGQGRLAEAAECFRKAIEIDPAYDDAVEALGDVETALAWSARIEAASKPPAP